MTKIDIQCDHKKDGNRVLSSKLSWKHEGNNIELQFSCDASYVYSNVINKLIVELYGEKKIQLFSDSGELVREFLLPTLDGYQFRGLNKSSKSKTGVSLLFFPLSSDVGNEWSDIEQYEFVLSDCPLGKKLGIYR